MSLFVTKALPAKFLPVRKKKISSLLSSFLRQFKNLAVIKALPKIRDIFYNFADFSRE